MNKVKTTTNPQMAGEQLIHQQVIEVNEYPSPWSVSSQTSTAKVCEDTDQGREMKFIEIIKSNHWLSVEIILLELYPDQVKQIDEYERVFKELQQKEPVESDILIFLKQYYSDPSESWIGVAGSDLKDTTYDLALDFTPWQEWLGMDIMEETIKNFTELEIIAHCLWEMTFIGFDESKIQAELSSLEQSVEELKNMTEEERKANTMTLDELMEKLRSEDDSNPSEK